MGKRSREKKERRLTENTVLRKEKPGISVEGICKKLILMGTILILFTPLIISGKFFFPFVGPKSLFFMGLVEIIFFAWLFLVFISPKYRPRFNPILIALILFLLISILASVFGADLSYSFWSKFERMTGILMILHLLAFFLVISTCFEKSDWKIIFTVSLFVGVIISFIALTSKNPSMRGGATIGNDSFLGTYLLFNLFLALYLILKSEIGLRIYSSICFIIMALTLILSGARAVKLSFLGGLILLFFLWLAFYQKGKLRRLGIFLLIFSLISLIIFTFFAFQPESFVRKGVIEKNVGETFGGRFIVWAEAWKGFLQRPILGWGLENFEFAFTSNYNSCLGTARCASDIWYDRAHNIIFDTLVASGILGMLSYFGIFIAVFYIIWKNYFNKKFDFWICGVLTVLLISYFIQNSTVFDMVSSYMIFFLVLGYIGSTSYLPKEFQATKKSNFFYFFVVIIILILFFLSFLKFVIQPLQTDAFVIQAIQTSEFESRISLYQKALTTSPVGRYQIREFFADRTMEFIQSDAARKAPTEEIEQELDFISKELEKTIKESPYNYRSYLKLGQVYNIYSRFDSQKLSLAEDVLEKAISLSPTNQQGYWASAQTKIYKGEFKKAVSLAEKAKDLEPKLQRSYEVLVNIARIIGDRELGEEKIKEASEIDPSWEPELRKILD